MGNLFENMKALESASTLVLPSAPFAVFRYDGVGFSKYTKRFQAPEDALFMEAMDRAAQRLMEQFSALGAYVVSDEISLFLKAGKDGSLAHGGNVVKTASIGAGILSASFTATFPDSPAAFDGRGFALENDEMLRQYLVSRMRSGYKNSVSMVAHHLVPGSHKKIMGIPTSERLSFLADHGIDFEKAVTPGFTYGRLLFKESATKTVSFFNKKTKVEEVVSVVRKETRKEVADFAKVKHQEDVPFDASAFFLRG